MYKIEEFSLWYHYKTKVWLDTAPQTAIVHNIMRVLRGVRGTFNYISTPITSGRVMYDNSDYDMSKIISINVLNGLNFADAIKDIQNLIVPCELVPTDHYKWEQDHFQALWLSIIAEKCENVYMNNGWEYSNGCVEELVHSFQLRLGIPRHKELVFFNTKESEEESVERMKNIKVFDHNRNEITMSGALESISNAMEYIKTKNKSVYKLERAKSCLVKTIDNLKA